MECIKGTEDLRAVEKDPVPSLLILAHLQIIFVDEHPVKVLTGQVLKHEVDIFFVHKRLIEHDNEVQRLLVRTISI